MRTFALPHLPSLTALAILLCILFTSWITFRHAMVSQLSICCGSAHDEFSFLFICFLPLTGSIKISCHKAPVGGQLPGSYRGQSLSTAIPVVTTGHSLLSTSLSEVSQCLTVMVFDSPARGGRERKRRASTFRIDDKQ